MQLMLIWGLGSSWPYWAPVQCSRKLTIPSRRSRPLPRSLYCFILFCDYWIFFAKLGQSQVKQIFIYHVQFSSVTKSCPTLCDPMNRSTSGHPVHHQLPEFTQTHIHQVGDAIQPSHPLARMPSLLPHELCHGRSSSLAPTHSKWILLRHSEDQIYLACENVKCSHWSSLFMTNNFTLLPSWEILILYCLYLLEKNQWLAFWGQIRRMMIINFLKYVQQWRKENCIWKGKGETSKNKSIALCVQGPEPRPSCDINAASWI